MSTTPYYDSITMIERLHRHYLDVLKAALERSRILDINNVQSLILYNIGDEELTVGELTMRGYYLGSNVSYNVKKMVENGYLSQARSKHDKRSVRVKLSDKGKKLKDALAELHKTHETNLAESPLTDERFDEMNKTLIDLETFWTAEMSKGLLNIHEDEK